MGAQGAEFGVCFTSSMEDWAARGAAWETPRSGGLVLDELGYHATGFVTHTGSDVEDLDHDGVVVGQADWMVISEAIHLDQREREVLRRKCASEAADFDDAEMLQGDECPSQRIVIFAKHRNVAVDVAMRCFQASAGKIHFRVLEARAMYAAFDLEQTLRHAWLLLPTIEQEIEILKQQHAGDHGLVRQLDDLRRTVRPMIDEIERILTDAERIEDEKVDQATQIIKRFNDKVSDGAYALKPSTSLRSVMHKAGKAGA